jgi:hypothetical protein
MGMEGRVEWYVWLVGVELVHGGVPEWLVTAQLRGVKGRSERGGRPFVRGL